MNDFFAHRYSPIVERGRFFGCMVQTYGAENYSTYSIFTDDREESEWDLKDIEAIDDLIGMLTELRKVNESDCT